MTQIVRNAGVEPEHQELAGKSPARTVFLLDVDNTLLDNDRLKNDLAKLISSIVGRRRAPRFWEIYEEVRREEDFVDYPETVRRWGLECRDLQAAGQLMAILGDLPFQNYLYPHVFETLAYLETIGEIAIVSDGDTVFQPLKIRNSGIEAEVHGNVMITTHKERELEAVFARFLSEHYVTVDDKPQILASMKRDFPSTFTTILVKQGKYAVENDVTPAPDYTVQRIGDLRSFSAQAFALPVTHRS
jgi:FMN phosphatase YigB (HAD superfamily)